MSPSDVWRGAMLLNVVARHLKGVYCKPWHNYYNNKHKWTVTTKPVIERIWNTKMASNPNEGRDTR